VLTNVESNKTLKDIIMQLSQRYLCISTKITVTGTTGTQKKRNQNVHNYWWRKKTRKTQRSVMTGK
jgi:hypothetical protein